MEQLSIVLELLLFKFSADTEGERGGWIQAIERVLRIPLIPQVSFRIPLIPQVSFRIPLIPKVSFRIPLIPQVSFRYLLYPRLVLLY